MIQPLCTSDQSVCERIINLQLPAYEVEAELLGFKDIPPLNESAEDIQDSEELYYGYHVEGHLVGFVSIEDDETAGVLDITRLVVHPTYFRTGIGTTLLQYVLGLHNNQTKVRVMTGKMNIPAIALYEKFGFKAYEEIEVAPNVLLISMELIRNKGQ
ncbi:acetyltransferase [Pontibacillus halophilus JSM 076056 = DSM 19796]|uniref:Acetyltransferase n=1 Tax=Pontibacillus halophilus JSM 076056 = DSM 19796 TaxID=1385510 RepID=A0A0A5GLK5_9BACI|nr:GNAT family N-acetyltransferase [Pontibacillus halophilus]KGX92884.1 acetyltransferase [Pontibacillus halophilus JSM 076056 = DSM 19796]